MFDEAISASIAEVLALGNTFPRVSLSRLDYGFRTQVSVITADRGRGKRGAGERRRDVTAVYQERLARS